MLEYKPLFIRGPICRNDTLKTLSMLHARVTENRKAKQNSFKSLNLVQSQCDSAAGMPRITDVNSHKKINETLLV